MRWDEREMELGRPGNSRVQKKRKAESQDNERLSKRLSLLNLERNGQKLYVPVEAPSTSASETVNPTTNTRTSPRSLRSPKAPQDDSMQLDDTKHKVYIYDLDAELSDSDTSDDGKLVFLPDISKHLRETRIPPSILANKEGELAGMNKELVLYNVPSAISVPEGQDSVRRAVIEARARLRGKNEETETEVKGSARAIGDTAPSSRGFSVGHSTSTGTLYGGTWMPNGSTSTIPETQQQEDDPDAMDLE